MPRAPRRQRRTAEEARTAILDATERQLVAVGPEGIRLAQVAAEVGVSHPTVLHHFGSRERLVQAVVLRALAALEADVLVALEQAPEGHAHFGPLLDRVFAAFDARGHGRALAWLALAGLTPDDPDPRLRAVVEVAHARRRGHAPKGQSRRAFFEDTLFTVLLSVSALFAQSVIGPALFRALGVDDDAGAPVRYRAWLAALLVRHLGGAP